MGLGHFYKHFVKNARRKVSREKMWEFFLLDILKTTLQTENVIQEWSLSGHFLQNQGTFFFHFQNKAGETSPPLPP